MALVNCKYKYYNIKKKNLAPKLECNALALLIFNFFPYFILLKLLNDNHN